MAADDRDPEAPSLEPPSLRSPSLGLFRKRRGKADPPPAPASGSDPVAPAPEPSATAEPTDASEPDATPTEVVGAVEPGAHEPAAPPLFADEAPPTRDIPETADPEETATLPATVEPARRTRRPRRQRPRRSTPLLTGVAAVLLTGLVVGLGTVGLTAGGLQACEAARGTPSCGGSGLALLLLILAAMVFLGGWLLRAFHIPDPGSTSFLAVGVLAVVALVFLIDHLLEWWMVIVIPLVSVAAYALSHWVTTAVIEPARE